LAYYKRIRFGQKAEVLAGLQRDLFREDVETDLAAIEAELESLKANPKSTVAASHPARTGRKMLLHFLHSPHPCGLPAAVTRPSAAHRTPA
jgi:hypothetical protein